MTDTASRIVVAHDQLTAKLAELRRRETLMRSQLSPIRYLASPWLYVAIAGLVGYRLGRPGARSLPVAAPRPAPVRAESMTHAVVRASVVAAAQALVGRAVLSLVSER
jgi:hypothetical protein